MRAFLFVTLAFVAVQVTGFADAKASEPPACSGTDIVAEQLDAGDAVFKSAVEASKAIENDGAVLWKLEMSGKPASYLFGTMHSTDARLTRLSPAVEQAIAAVDTVALELTSGSDAEMVGLMMKSPGTFFYTDGKTLADALSADRLGKLRTSMSGTGMPVDTLKPWMASMLLAVSECERTRMAAQLPVLDSVIEARAKSLGKNTVALESVELQVSAMSELPMDDQIPQLRMAIDLYQRADDLSETIKRLYIQRKIGLVWTMNLALAQKSGVSKERFRAFEQSLIVKRNRGMAQKAFALMERGPMLIAVGALHLVGKTGLVALAREAGYTATPIE